MDISFAVDEVMDDDDWVAVADAVSVGWLSFLKNGFLLSLLEGKELRGAEATGGLVVAGDSVKACLEVVSDSFGCMLSSLERTWLFVGVVPCGVISCGPSSSEESSSPRLSSCN